MNSSSKSKCRNSRPLMMMSPNLELGEKEESVLSFPLLSPPFPSLLSWFQITQHALALMMFLPVALKVFLLCMGDHLCQE